MIDETRLYQALGQRLRAAREQQSGSRGRLTQAELASKVGLERTSITNIEKGTQKVPLHVLFRLCQALNASVTELLPSISEVQHDKSEKSFEEVPFNGLVMKAPPLASQAITKLLNTITDTNAPPHS